MSDGLIYVPGEYICRKCDFRLMRKTISPSGMSDDATPVLEPCPNECGLLERMTWKQSAEEGWTRAEALMEEVIQLREQVFDQLPEN